MPHILAHATWTNAACLRLVKQTSHSNPWLWSYKLCKGLVPAVIAVNSWLQWPCHAWRQHFPASLPSSGSHIISVPSSVLFSESYRGWNKGFVQGQAINGPLFSALKWAGLCIHCCSLERETLWVRLKATLVSECKHKYSEAILTPWQFS